jgi:hypothetical protein
MKNYFGLLLIFVLSGISFGPALAAPANDNFVNRTVLSGTNLTVSGSNVGAGTESGEYIGGGNIYYFYSVWYEWTAPTNGVLYVSGSTTAYGFIISDARWRNPGFSRGCD